MSQTKSPHHLIAERLEMLVDRDLLSISVVYMNTDTINAGTREVIVDITDDSCSASQEKINLSLNVKDITKEIPVYEVFIQRSNHHWGTIKLHGIQEVVQFLTDFKETGIPLSNKALKLVSWNNEASKESQRLIINAITSGVELSAHYIKERKELKIKFY